MREVKVISIDNLHTTIVKFIADGTHIIGEYDDMKEVILLMIKSAYMFNMDRDRLRDAMEDITYMMCPSDDINKDRVSRGLEYEEEDSGSDSEYDDVRDSVCDHGHDHEHCSSETVEDIGEVSHM